MEKAAPQGNTAENYLQVATIKPFENIALAFSGGGFRAATFGLGVLSYLNKIKFDGADTLSGNTLLQRVTYMSSASGGTIPTTLYALYSARGKTFGQFYVKLFETLTGDRILEKALVILADKKRWDKNSKKARNIINAFSVAYDEAFFEGISNVPRQNLRSFQNFANFIPPPLLVSSRGDTATEGREVYSSPFILNTMPFISSLILSWQARRLSCPASGRVSRRSSSRSDGWKYCSGPSSTCTWHVAQSAMPPQVASILWSDAFKTSIRLRLMPSGIPTGSRWPFLSSIVNVIIPLELKACCFS